MNTALLKEQELEHCQRIANRRTTHGKRAIALLAVHEGQTQTQAAAKSGLTPGGVRYWIGKFRAQRLGIFSPVSGSAPVSTAAPKPSAKAKTGETKGKAPKPKKKKKSKKKKRSKDGKKKSKKKDKKGGKKGKKPQRGKGKRSKEGKKSKT